ncbi:hypothetical protein M9Y10_035899 [Tritrichomonas musculus]|uniref:Surface antigen BspA-like n=1 Tax=Tritrichomonas musculus TaxID=1915356 RepID=A0ABR2GVK1_9EUKA
MFAPLFLLFASTKLVLAVDNHENYGCYSSLTKCSDTDKIEITSPFNMPHYCNCNNANRNYQVTFKMDNEDKTLFTIPSQFFVSSKISSVTIPKNCEEIEAGAFYGSTIDTFTFQTDASPILNHDSFGDVTFTNTLTLPNSYTNIPSNAFYYSYFRSSVILPDDLTTVSDYAFYLATFIEDLTFKSKVTTLQGYSFYFARFSKTVKFENANTAISQNTFKQTTFVGSLTLPTQLTSIPISAFESAKFGSAFSVPSKVTEISTSAFKNAQFSGNLVLPSSLNTIYGNAFEEAQFIGSITFQNTETSILSSAFKGATFHKTLALPTALETITSNTFQEAVFQHSITFPSVLKTISSSAFQEAQFTDTISLPASLETIGTSAFKSCIFNSDTILNFGSSLETIGNTAFQDSNLQSISFDSKAKLESIGQKAFEGLFQLKVVGDSKALYSETISESAFEGDENLDFTSITSENINKFAFRNCFNLEAKEGILILADGSVQEAAFINCKKLSGGLKVEDPIYSTVRSSIGKRAFMDTGLTYLHLPHISSISDDAFRNCVSLKGATDEKYKELFVDSISGYAFDGDILLHYDTIKSENIAGYAFQYCRNLGSNITILGRKDNDVITLGTIGEYSFYSCDQLGTVTFDISPFNDYETIPTSYAMSIPQYAFAKSGLTGPLVIPPNINEISQYAFSNCPNINELQINRQYSIPLEIKTDAFRNSNIGKELVIPKYVTSLESRSFANTPIESLTIEGTTFTQTIKVTQTGPDGNPVIVYDYRDLTTTIKNDAFRDCSALKTLVFGNDSITIYGDSFRGCHPKTLQLGNVNSIPTDAFVGMSLIDSAISIPDSITTIGDRAFSECSNIPSISISPNSKLTSIGNAAFYKCKKIESIVIPPGVKTISEYAFYQCENLKEITILSRIEDSTSSITIEDYAFYGCSQLTKNLTLPEGLTSIGEGAFQECAKLGGPITFPYSLTTIKERAFMGCGSLTGSLNFDVNVEEVGKYAFRDCRGLNGIKIIDYYGVDSYTIYLHEGAFYGCSGLKGDLNIPIRCQLKKAIKEVNPDGSTTTRYETSSNVFKGCSSLDGQLTLPATIKEIPAGTFCDCSLLNGQVKNDLEYIGREAFKNCAKFTGSVDLSSYDHSRFVGSYAFYNCIGLNGQLIFRELSNEVFIKIGEYAFYNCNGLTGPLNCSSLSVIEKYAFTGCSGLNGSLIFGLYLLKVGEYAFADCTGFSGTLSFRSIMDNELSIEESAFKGCTGFKDGTLLIIMDRSNSAMKPSGSYYLKIERNAFEDTKFKDIRYIGRDQPDCDCDIGIPSRKGIHTSSNYEGKSFCGNPLHKSKLSGGAIAGIVIACIVVVALIVALVVYFILKNKRNGDKSEAEVEMNQDP